MNEEEKKAIKSLKGFAYTIHGTLSVGEAKTILNLIENLQKENKDLQESVDQIYEDYKDAGLRMFQYSETLDKVKEFVNQKIHYKVSHKQGDELKNILMKEVVRQLNMYRTEILKIIKEGEKSGHIQKKES